MFALSACGSPAPEKTTPQAVSTTAENLATEPPAEYDDKNQPNAVTPIDFSQTQTIGKGLPAFTFKLEGVAKESFYQISKLTISGADGKFEQAITGLSTGFHASDDSYGLELADWNFDGFLDISLLRADGGSSGNSPHYYWLWDAQKNRFAENKQLTEKSELNSLQIKSNEKQITGFSRAGPREYHTVVMEYRAGEYVIISTEAMLFTSIDDDPNHVFKRVIVEKNINGKMVVTSDTEEKVFRDE
jgi:hypothetical protein